MANPPLAIFHSRGRAPLISALLPIFERPAGTRGYWSYPSVDAPRCESHRKMDGSATLASIPVSCSGEKRREERVRHLGVRFPAGRASLSKSPSRNTSRLRCALKNRNSRNSKSFLQRRPRNVPAPESQTPPAYTSVGSPWQRGPTNVVGALP